MIVPPPGYETNEITIVIFRDKIQSRVKYQCDIIPSNFNYKSIKKSEIYLQLHFIEKELVFHSF